LSIEYGQGGNIVPVYLKIQKPLSVNAKGESWNDIYFDGAWEQSTNDIFRAAQAKKKDGAVIKNVVDVADRNSSSKKATTFAVFSPTQIKSAVGNIGKFDPTSRDITK
jgi:hypothetical protein